MISIQQSETFRKWFSGIRDKVARMAIASRIDRASMGNFGDCEPVGQGVSEMRIHYGPGYRVYYQQRGETIVLLLAGGTKARQASDIKLAHQVADQYKDDQS